MTRHCERSEAIQAGDADLDCFVASLLAMTEFGHQLTKLGAMPLTAHALN